MIYDWFTHILIKRKRIVCRIRCDITLSRKRKEEKYIKVKVHVYSPDTMICSADFTLVTPMYWDSLFHNLVSLGRVQHNSHNTNFYSTWYPLLLGGQRWCIFKACPRLLQKTSSVGIEPRPFDLGSKALTTWPLQSIGDNIPPWVLKLMHTSLIFPACSCEHVDIVRLLLRHKADPAVKDVDSTLPRDCTTNAEILKIIDSHSTQGVSNA